MFTDEEKRIILNISYETLKHYFSYEEKLKVTEEEINNHKLFEKRGTFVTLTKRGNLRGCIGSILPLKPLIYDVIDNTINAAFRDPRFPPLSESELPLIEIEVSVLTVPKKLDFSGKDDLLEKLKPGKDGVIIVKGAFQATFLPQVWDDLPDKEDFLANLCAKAGLSPYEYRNPKDLEVYTYEVEIIK